MIVPGILYPLARYDYRSKKSANLPFNALRSAEAISPNFLIMIDFSIVANFIRLKVSPNPIGIPLGQGDIKRCVH